MGLLFSYVSYRFLPVVFVGLGLTTALGLMGLAGIQLNMAVMGAFPVMIGLGIDYAIQFHARLDEESRKGSLDDAVYMTITKTGPAVMYAMLATSLGICGDVHLHRPHDPVVRPRGHDRHHELLLRLARGSPGRRPGHPLQTQTRRLPRSVMRSAKMPAILSRHHRKNPGPMASSSPVPR